MKQAFLWSIATAGVVFFSACQADPVTKIPALEKALDTAYSATTADSLVQFYLDAVKAHPDQHADNLRYLTRAAGIKFIHQKDPLAAVRLIDQGLKNHAQGQNLSEPLGMLARIWSAYQYKSTPDLSKNPDDIDQMRSNLEKNLPWIDSSLVALDKSLGGAGATNKTLADAFIQTSEGYAALVQADTNKYVNLVLKAAGLAKTVGNPNKALQLYYYVGEKLPAHPKAPTALFMEAFIFENDLHDLDKAKSMYEEFLKRYPNDPDYADDAQNALKYLGKSAEEIIRQFEQAPQ
ncbi:MAG: hypothetical protein IT260_19815 [Saprospiraceae bacterium]|nr:hypothetical protein [Saprospiraceae bacterium]